MNTDVFLKLSFEDHQYIARRTARRLDNSSCLPYSICQRMRENTCLSITFPISPSRPWYWSRCLTMCVPNRCPVFWRRTTWPISTPLTMSRNTNASPSVWRTRESFSSKDLQACAAAGSLISLTRNGQDPNGVRNPQYSQHCNLQLLQELHWWPAIKQHVCLHSSSLFMASGKDSNKKNYLSRLRLIINNQIPKPRILVWSDP